MDILLPYSLAFFFYHNRRSIIASSIYNGNRHLARVITLITIIMVAIPSYLPLKYIILSHLVTDMLPL